MPTDPPGRASWMDGALTAMVFVMIAVGVVLAGNRSTEPGTPAKTTAGSAPAHTVTANATTPAVVSAWTGTVTLPMDTVFHVDAPQLAPIAAPLPDGQGHLLIRLARIDGDGRMDLAIIGTLTIGDGDSLRFTPYAGGIGTRGPGQTTGVRAGPGSWALPAGTTLTTQSPDHTL
jgi:hypothetical protein